MTQISAGAQVTFKTRCQRQWIASPTRNDKVRSAKWRDIARTWIRVSNGRPNRRPRRIGLVSGLEQVTSRAFGGLAIGGDLSPRRASLVQAA